MSARYVWLVLRGDGNDMQPVAAFSDEVVAQMVAGQMGTFDGESLGEVVALPMIEAAAERQADSAEDAP
ncbi:MAG TPA: hypothetical protein VM305_01205 [Candidatus Limnocylindrales bacterium]|nr:hypothetical protein [Candidatus Limnocylindrales bacterium]